MMIYGIDWGYVDYAESMLQSCFWLHCPYRVSVWIEGGWLPGFSKTARVRSCSSHIPTMLYSVLGEEVE